MLRYLAVCSLLVIGACSSDDNDHKSDDRSPSFEMADLDTLALRSLSRQELLTEVNSNHTFYATDPQREESRTTEQSDDLLDQCAPLKDQVVTVKDHELTAAIDIDVGRDCKIKGWDASKQTYRLKYLVQLRCLDVPLDQYEGMRVIDFSTMNSGAQPCQQSKRTEMRISVDYLRQQKSDQKDGMTIDLDIRVRRSGAEGTYCTTTTTKEGFAYSPCRTTDYAKTFFGYEKDRGLAASDGGESVVYSRIESPALSTRHGDRYYAEGRFLVTINNWGGEVANQGANEPPLIKMSNGKASVEEPYMGYAYGLHRTKDSPAPTPSPQPLSPQQPGLDFNEVLFKRLH